MMFVFLVACTPAPAREASSAAATVPPGATASAAPTPQAATPTSAATQARSLQGTISIDGSSTVFPIAEAIAAEFMLRAPDVEVQLGVSGTGGGFEKFCAGETVISNASRPIKQSEMADCAANDVAFIELPIAYDGLSIVVNPQNDWVACLTVDELRRMWEPAAEGMLMRWNQIRPEWPDAPLALYGAGADSGTFDYFTSAIIGEEAASRGDYIGSEDDYLLSQGVAAGKYALGYFGYAYYRASQDQLKLLQIDSGAGCVAPDEATIAANTYQPLSRPIFIYVNVAGLQRSEVAAFLDTFLDSAAQVAGDVKYVPLSDSVYALVRERLREQRTGSVFTGGSQVGLSIEQLLVLEQN
ncbi:MAG: PstS family phosphate ABC transporter substrate-binding protein [Roseiflexaceae bacterium]|nr:PstS family phosphate ABC transporter substrate-binding protein [Roseiflexaceae bacterium]